MISESRFADYHLFKRLSFSPLGETFRAGRVQSRTVNRVVQLYILNGDILDSEALGLKIREREDLQPLLQRPHFGRGVEVGVHEGTPFVAYDYVLGRSLLDTLQRAQSQHAFWKIDHALAVIEQAADALADAYRIHFEGGLIVHGYLTPEFIHLSHQGSVRLLGFELASALRTLGPDSQYLPPDVHTQEPATSADDVYSISSILFEMLTGARPNPNSSAAGEVDRALLAGPGGPLPPEIQDLLKMGLAPLERRVATIEDWLYELRRVMLAGAGGATDFQIAFFLHGLFRDDMEEDAQEMQSERSSRWSVAAEARESSADSETLEVGTGTDSEGEVDGTDAESTDDPLPFLPVETETTLPWEEEARKSTLRGSFSIGLAASVALCAVGAGVFFGFRHDNSLESRLQPDYSGAAADDSLVPEESTDPTAQSDPRFVVASRAAALENNLLAEFEPRLAELRERVLAARRQINQRSVPVTRVPSPSPPPIASQDPDPASPNTDSTPKVEEQTPNPEVPTAEVEPFADDEAKASVPLAIEELPEAVAQLAAADSETVLEELVQLSPGVSTETVKTLAEPTTPEILARPLAQPTENSGVGEPEVVDTGPGKSATPAVVEPPRLIERARPQFPEIARRLKKTAVVRLRVLVGAKGAVVETEVLSPPVGFGFESSAQRAAADSLWAPATRDGVEIEDWTTLTVAFRP